MDGSGVLSGKIGLGWAEINRQQLLRGDRLFSPAEGFLRRKAHGRSALLQEMGRCQNTGDPLL